MRLKVKDSHSSSAHEHTAANLESSTVHCSNPQSLHACSIAKRCLPHALPKCCEEVQPSTYSSTAIRLSAPTCQQTLTLPSSASNRTPSPSEAAPFYQAPQGSWWSYPLNTGSAVFRRLAEVSARFRSSSFCWSALKMMPACPWPS